MNYKFRIGDVVILKKEYREFHKEHYNSRGLKPFRINDLRSPMWWIGNTLSYEAYEDEDDSFTAFTHELKPFKHRIRIFFRSLF